MFERIAPICPACRGASPLVLSRVDEVDPADTDDVTAGWIECTEPSCRREFPIIDGVPILVPDPAAYLQLWGDTIALRDDLPADLSGRLIECTGTGSLLETSQRQIGQYVWDHWGEYDVDDASDEPGDPPGQVAALVDRLVAPAPAPAADEPRDDGPWLDVGCAVGRGTSRLARLRRAPVIGIDLHFPMLRWARAALRRGEAGYLRRELGLVYRRRELRLPDALPPVELWVADILDPPFSAQTFSGAVALNVLDCVRSPLRALQRLAELTVEDASVALATPYDWTETASQPIDWIGGHSPRADGAGDSAALLRALLTPGAHPAALDAFTIEAELDELPWAVRIHARSRQLYRLHGLKLRRRGDPTRS